MQRALEFAAANPSPRVVLLTDGVMTAGVTEGPNLQAAVLKLKTAGVKRLDAIAVGGIRDTAALTRLTTGSLESDGAVLDGARVPEELVARLALATKSKLEVKVKGASAWWPTTLSGVQAGDAVLVYAQLPAAQPFEVQIGGRTLPVKAGDLASIERPLLERAWAKAQLLKLEGQLDAADGAPERAKVKAQLVELSTKSRVLSSQTALLVLETEADYARFKIDRRALADILVVEGGRVKALKRSSDAVVLVQKTPVPSPAKNEKPSVEKPSKKRPADDSQDEGGKADPGAPADGADAEKKEAKVELAEEESVPSPKPVPSSGARAPSAGPPPPAPVRRPEPMAEPSLQRESRAGLLGGATADAPWNKGSDPYTGKFKEVMVALEKKDKSKALATAAGWHEEQPGDLLALVALGEALEASGDLAKAARAYGSIIDLFSARADLRRFAGVRLERIAAAMELAIDDFAKAADQRPDHPASHRLLAFALVRAGKFEAAFEAISRGVKQQYPDGRFRGVDRILREDAGLIAAAWMKAEPKRRGEIEGRLKAIGGTPETQPSLRFVLNWETDSNDVDFHIHDGKGGHAFYSSKELPSGGALYEDVTTGYGPECFTIRLPKNKRSYPYRLQAHYYSIGPMGAGMGKLELIEHDGEGGLRFEQRPYVVMVNQAFVDLGVVKP